MEQMSGGVHQNQLLHVNMGRHSQLKGQGGNGSSGRMQKEVDISCLKEQICRAQLSSSAFSLLFAIFKYLTQGTTQEKNQCLNRYITCFFIQKLKINPQNQYLSSRINAGITSNPIIIYDKTYILFGIDMMTNSNLQKMFNKGSVKMSRIDASHCLIEFDSVDKGWECIKGFFAKQKKGEMVHWNENNNILCREWIKFISYTELIFQRQIWIRNFTQADQEEVNTRNSVILNGDDYQKAKKELYQHLKADQDISTLLNEVKKQYDIKNLNQQFQIEKVHKKDVSRHVGEKKEYRYQDYVNLREGKKESNTNQHHQGNRRQSKPNDRRERKKFDNDKIKPFEMNNGPRQKAISTRMASDDQAEIMTITHREPNVKIEQQSSGFSSFERNFQKCHINSQISDIAENSNHMISTSMNKILLESYLISGIHSHNLTSNQTTITNQDSSLQEHSTLHELRQIQEEEMIVKRNQEEENGDEDQIDVIAQSTHTPNPKKMPLQSQLLKAVLKASYQPKNDEKTSDKKKTTTRSRNTKQTNSYNQ